MLHSALPYPGDPWGPHQFQHHPLEASTGISVNITKDSNKERSPTMERWNCRANIVERSPQVQKQQPQKSFRIDDILRKPDNPDQQRGQDPSPGVYGSSVTVAASSASIQNGSNDSGSNSGIPARPIPIRASSSHGSNQTVLNGHHHHHHHQQQQQQNHLAGVKPPPPLPQVPILKPTPMYDPLTLNMMAGLPYQQLAMSSTYPSTLQGPVGGGVHNIFPYARPELLFFERTGVYPKSKLLQIGLH